MRSVCFVRLGQTELRGSDTRPHCRVATNLHSLSQQLSSASAHCAHSKPLPRKSSLQTPFSFPFPAVFILNRV